MNTCDYCHEKVNVVYICSKCGGSFCGRHKSPGNHNCAIEKKSDFDGIEISVEEDIEESKDNLDNYDVLEVAIDGDVVLDFNPDSPILESTWIGGDFSHEPSDERARVTGDTLGWLYDMYERVRSNRYSLVLVSFLLISGVFNGYLYLEYQDYVELSGNYVGLYNTSKRLQLYYDNLTSQYMELRQEYSQLNEIYSEVIFSKAELEREHFDIMNYRKEIQLVEGKTITLEPNQNYTEIHEVPFSGYIMFNYTASSEVYTWVGSSSLEESFYSRNPQFPDTSSGYNFTIPVLPDILIYLANPNGESVEVTYWVNYTY